MRWPLCASHCLRAGRGACPALQSGTLPGSSHCAPGMTWQIMCGDGPHSRAHRGCKALWAQEGCDPPPPAQLSVPLTPSPSSGASYVSSSSSWSHLYCLPSVGFPHPPSHQAAPLTPLFPQLQSPLCETQLRPATLLVKAPHPHSRALPGGPHLWLVRVFLGPACSACLRFKLFRRQHWFLALLENKTKQKKTKQMWPHWAHISAGNNAKGLSREAPIGTCVLSGPPSPPLPAAPCCP